MNYDIVLPSKPRAKKLLFIAIFLIINFGFFNIINAEEILDLPPEHPSYGVIEGEGNHFEITDSIYLNIALDSSEPIKLRMESVPEMITMMLERATSTSTTQTQITISGFSPLINYYKFEDNYHNLTQFTTDGNGKYTFTQDLSNRHFVFIQPRMSTKFIKDDATGGDCVSIGAWNANTKTCTLTTDLTESIQIDNDAITLDGNGHSTTGTNTGFGIYLYQKSEITVKNITIKNFSLGIVLRYSSQSILINNVISNTYEGVNLRSSTNNNLIQNNIANNNDGIGSYYYSDNNNFSNNVISNNDSDGVGFYDSSNNTFTGNTVSNNHYDGIDLYTSNVNHIAGNVILGNGSDGLAVYTSANNDVSGNTISNSGGDGVPLYYSANNKFTSNTISSNNDGMAFYHSNSNKVYNNNFITNSTQVRVYSSTGNTFNLNPPTGGNYWDNFDTLIEGCNDLNNDDFCDVPYVFTGGQDNLPWTTQDGWEVPPNQPPTFSSLNQHKSDGQTEIYEGGTTTESSQDNPTRGIVVFKAIVSDPDNDQVKLQIELKEFSQPFNGQNLLESELTTSGSEVAITRTALFERQYKWRARAIDNQGNTSNWQEFGSPGNVDFIVKLVPLYTQVFSKYPSEEETFIWAELDYAKGVASSYSCGSKIRDCGCAITSEVMVMRFYNISTTADGKNVDPARFNEWSTNNDGYWSNGDVKWEKIKDYSKDQFGISRLVYSGPVNSEDTNILNGQLYNLQPAILNIKVLNRQGKLVDHFIVADGKLSATYTVKDPIYYLTKSLNQPRSSYIYDYDNHFVGLRLFSPIAVLPDSISAHFASPGELLFTDPLGRRLGKDPISNIEYNEIPNGVYYQESIGNPESDIVPEASKNIWIPEPITGQYDIQVIGTEVGSYTFSILTYDQAGNSKDIAQTGNILPDITQDFELNYSTTLAEQTKLQRIVNIDIKPGSDPNSINCQNPKGIIPVAILTTPIFDATTVDADTIRFGPSAAQEIHKDKNNKAKRHIEDADKDEDLDLVLHFKFADTGIQCGDTSATLTGKTADNADIIGSDSIRTVRGGSKQTLIGKFFGLLANVYEALSQLL